MAGPEQLEAGPSASPARGRWVVLAVVVLVLVGLAIHHGSGSGPAPPTPSPSGTVRRPRLPPPWPAGAVLPSGTLYVLAGTGLYAVDAGSGLVGTTSVEVDASETSLTPMAGGVLASRGDGASPVLVAYGNQDGQVVGGAARGADVFIPGEGGQVWARSTRRGAPRDPARPSTWRLVDDEGRATANVEVRGVAVGDGSGGLFDADVDGSTLRYAYPRGPEEWRDTVVLATGSDGFELLRCAQGRCTAGLHDRATGRTEEAAPFPSSSVPGVLSPGNRFVVRVVRGADDGDEVQVSETGTGVLRRALPGGSRATSVTWLSERWLVSTSGAGLSLYDAVDDDLLQPALPIDAIAQLVWAPA